MVGYQDIGSSSGKRGVVEATAAVCDLSVMTVGRGGKVSGAAPRSGDGWDWVGQRKTVWMYTAHPKNFAVEVKSSEGVVKGVEGVFGYNILACNVTKIEESVEGLDDISGHITL